MRTIVVKGDAYSMGVALGVCFKDCLQRTIGQYGEALKKEDIYRRVKELEEKLCVSFKEGLQEIYGRADGAGIDRDAMLLLFFPEVFKKAEGCTTIMLRKHNGSLLFCHNEDDKEFSVDNTAFVTYDYGDFKVAGYTNAEKLLGSSFALNNAGMLFSTNYIYSPLTKLENISRYVLSRKLMNTRSIEETMKVIREMEVASPFSLNVYDKKCDKAFNIEKDHKDIYVTEVTDRYGRANHFTAKKIDINEIPKSSAFRDAYVHEEIAKLDAENVTLADLKKILDYREEDYYRCVYKDPRLFEKVSVTVANLAYDAERDELILTDYLGNEVVQGKFDSFFL